MLAFFVGISWLFPVRVRCLFVAFRPLDLIPRLCLPVIRPVKLVPNKWRVSRGLAIRVLLVGAVALAACAAEDACCAIVGAAAAVACVRMERPGDLLTNLQGGTAAA